MDLQIVEVYRAMADTYFKSYLQCRRRRDAKRAAVFRQHSERLHLRAAATLLYLTMQKYPDMDTVDLHFFRVKEAMEIMDLFIDSHIRRLQEAERHGSQLFIITGRGLHSLHGPQIKPACMKRLLERGLMSFEAYHNPGMLRTSVTRFNKLTCELEADDHVT